MTLGPTGAARSGADAPIEDADLQAFVDGCVDEARRRAILDYLELNPHDATRVEAFERQKELFGAIRSKLDALDTATFNPVLQRDLAQALRRARHRRRIARRALAASVMILAVGGTALFGYERLADERLPLHLVARDDSPEFTFGGRIDVPAVVAPRSDGEASMMWLGQYLTGEALQLPDLTPLGLDLVGGGVVSGTFAPAVRLVYADTADRYILIYVGVVASRAEQAFTLMPEGNFSLHWRRGNLVFALIGGIDSPRLLDVMRLVNEGVVQHPAVPAADTGTVEASTGSTNPVGTSSVQSADAAVTTLQMQSPVLPAGTTALGGASIEAPATTIETAPSQGEPALPNDPVETKTSETL